MKILTLTFKVNRIICIKYIVIMIFSNKPLTKHTFKILVWTKSKRFNNLYSNILFLSFSSTSNTFSKKFLNNVFSKLVSMLFYWDNSITQSKLLPGQLSSLYIIFLDQKFASKQLQTNAQLVNKIFWKIIKIFNINGPQPRM